MEAFEDIKLNTKKDIIIEGLMKSNGVYLIVSQPKVGKSLFALQLANSIANGLPATASTTGTSGRNAFPRPFKRWDNHLSKL